MAQNHYEIITKSSNKLLKTSKNHTNYITQLIESHLFEEHVNQAEAEEVSGYTPAEYAQKRRLVGSFLKAAVA